MIDIVFLIFTLDYLIHTKCSNLHISKTLLCLFLSKLTAAYEEHIDCVIPLSRTVTTRFWTKSAPGGLDAAVRRELVSPDLLLFAAANQLPQIPVSSIPGTRPGLLHQSTRH